VVLLFQSIILVLLGAFLIGFGYLIPMFEIVGAILFVVALVELIILSWFFFKENEKNK